MHACMHSNAYKFTNSELNVQTCRHDWFYYTSTKCAIPDDMQTCTFMCVLAHLFEYIHIYVRTCTFTCVHEDVCAYMNIYVHAYTFMCVHAFICIHIHLCAYLHIYLHTYTFMCVHAHLRAYKKMYVRT